MADNLPVPHHAPVYQPTEVFHTDESVVACDGGGGPLGHPRVFLRFVAREKLCPYCSRLFVLNPGARSETGH